MRTMSLTGEAWRYNLRNKDPWLLRMTTLGKCWWYQSDQCGKLSESSRNHCTENLHLFPRKLVATGETRAEKDVCSPQAPGMGNTGRDLLQLAKCFEKKSV